MVDNWSLIGQQSINPPPFLLVRGIEPPTKFSKGRGGGGLDRVSIFRGESWKRGVTFLSGLQFLHKKIN